MSGRWSGDGHRNPLLTRLRRSRTVGEAELAALGNLLAAPRLLGARSDLLEEGARTARLHVLLDGWACRFRILADGSRQITAVLLPGDVCDLDGLYLGRSGHAVGTLTPCKVASLDRSALRTLAAHHAGVAQGLGWLVAVENAVLTEHVIGLGRRSARERMAHLLCELFQRLAVTGRHRESGYTLPMTQTDLSDVLGLTPVHVNRILQVLRGEGLIVLKGREMIIPDWQALCEAAEFRPDYLHLDGPGGPEAVRGPTFRGGASAAPSG